MGKINTSQKWLTLAELDLLTAEHLAKTMVPPPLEIICFHCQQAVEKYLKSFITGKGVEPPYIHDLDELCKIGKKYNSSFSNIADSCSSLTEYGVRPQYEYGMEILESDMLLSLKHAKAVKAFMLSIIPDSSNDNSGKIKQEQ
jgi:HEPN domain-containing protein